MILSSAAGGSGGGGGGGDVTAAANMTATALVVGDDGAKGVKDTAILVDGSDNVSGMGNLSLTGTADGRDLATDGTKLDGIESSATADQSNAEIKTAYEANADTNEFSDAEQTKLAGIEKTPGPRAGSLRLQRLQQCQDFLAGVLPRQTKLQRRPQ